MDAGLQQLLDSYLSHGDCSLMDCVCGLPPGGRSRTRRIGAPGRAASPDAVRVGDDGLRRKIYAQLCASARPSQPLQRRREIVRQRRARRRSGVPVTGWSNASRAACRNWRCRPNSPARAVLGIAARPDGRSPAGARGSGACGRSPACTRSSVALGSACSSVEVRARLARVVGVDRHAGAHAAVAADRRVDRAAARRRAPLDEREVLAPIARARERRLQRAVRVLGLGDDQQARGVAVEAVHDPRALGLRAAGRAPGQRLRERAGAVAARRVDDHRPPACRRRAAARPRRRSRRCSRPAAGAGSSAGRSLLGRPPPAPPPRRGGAWAARAVDA